MTKLRTETVEGYWLTPCVYCGMTADTRDHFVPRAWRAVLKQWQRLVAWSVPDTVPACKECNSTAGAKLFVTVAEKRTWIQHRYRLKYAKLLAAPFWSEADIAELTGALRLHVEASEGARWRLLQRLSWPYELGEEVVEALTRFLLRDFDTAAVLNAIRRREILR